MLIYHKNKILFSLQNNTSRRNVAHLCVEKTELKKINEMNLF